MTLRYWAASTAVLVSLVSIGGSAYADSSTIQSSDATKDLTSLQWKTTISKVNPFIITTKDGKVKISNSIDSLNLSPQQIIFVDQSVAAYNQVVNDGVVDITNHMAKKSEANLNTFNLKASLNSANSVTSSANSSGEFGLPYSWFHASFSESITYYYWWGDQVVLNEWATIKTETAVAMYGTGAGTIAAAAGVTLPIAVAILAYAGFYSSDMSHTDNGAGDNLQFATSFVPLSVSANWD